MFRQLIVISLLALLTGCAGLTNREAIEGQGNPQLWKAHKAQIGALAIKGGRADLVMGGDGRLNWQRIVKPTTATAPTTGAPTATKTTQHFTRPSKAAIFFWGTMLRRWSPPLPSILNRPVARQRS